MRSEPDLKPWLPQAAGRRALALFALVALAVIAAATAGCRQNMHNQNKERTFRESRFFADGSSARPLPANTVARGDLRADVARYTGLGANQQPIAELPMPVTRALLLRGQERYNVYCSPCHDRLGSGHGMIVQRGYKQPVSFTSDPRLLASQVGYFFNVMTDGYGVMPSYASQVPVDDRWAIAAYVRVLQYSANAHLAELPPAVQQQVTDDLAGKPAHRELPPGHDAGVARPDGTVDRPTVPATHETPASAGKGIE
ncbi:MAG TPA: cytochrome c [Thermoanaerobaculia bacterium]